MQWNAEQQELLNFWDSDLTRMIAMGSIRSGKSLAGMLGFYHGATEKFTGKRFILASPGSVNMENVIKRYANAYSRWQRKPIRATKDGFDMGGNHYIEAICNSIRSHDRLFGPDAQGAYIEEAEKIDIDTLRVIDSRCSMPGAKIMLVTNPPRLRHPFLLEYNDRMSELNGKSIHFDIRNNPGNTPEYIREQEELYRHTPHLYTRYIEGKPSSAEGAVWPHYTVGYAPSYDRAKQFYVSVDVGQTSPTHALLIGVWPEGEWVVAECIPNKVDLEMPPHKQVAEIHRQFSYISNPYCWVSDPAAANFNACIRDAGIRLVKADNTIQAGIETAGYYLGHGIIKISKRCEEFLKEISNYLLNPDTDLPVKDHDHGCDAFRYYAMFRKMLAHSKRKTRVYTRT